MPAHGYLASADRLPPNFQALAGSNTGKAIDLSNRLVQFNASDFGQE